MDTSDKNYKKLSQKLTKIDPPKNLFYECPFRTFNRAKPFTPTRGGMNLPDYRAKPFTPSRGWREETQ